MMQGWEVMELKIRVALLHVPRYPTDYVIIDTNLYYLFL